MLVGMSITIEQRIATTIRALGVNSTGLTLHILLNTLELKFLVIWYPNALTLVGSISRFLRLHLWWTHGWKQRVIIVVRIVDKWLMLDYKVALILIVSTMTSKSLGVFIATVINRHKRCLTTRVTNILEVSERWFLWGENFAIKLLIAAFLGQIFQMTAAILLLLL